MPKTRLINAVNDALAEEMARDERIILFGEDVKLSIFGDTRGLQAKFGDSRVRNTPISEATLCGMAVGAAAAGYRVVLHLMFANFVYTGFDAIANQMAKLRLMTGGQVSLPITVIAAYGGGRSTAAQHSDVPYPALMNLGAIKVAVPTTPADAKGLLKACIRDDTPAFFLEPGGRGGELGEVPDGDWIVPLGEGVIRRAGRDVTIVAIGAMGRAAAQAAATLAESGVEAEIIDPRTLVPLDTALILESVRRTHRLVVVDEARDCCSAASQIAAIVADSGFESLKAPIKRVTVPDVSMPYAPVLERAVLPDAAKIIAAVRSIV